VSTDNRIVSIVDDDMDITVLFQVALRSIGRIRILTFTDPILALEHFLLNDHTYATVICDSKMPGLNGMELLKKMKDLNQFVRTILITAYAIDQDLFMQYAKKRIINGFLQKPIRLDDLRDEVNNQLLAYESDRRRLPND
jgi:DNA-binding NtrC family response regulator